jgi:hypothetical protein
VTVTNTLLVNKATFTLHLPESRLALIESETRELTLSKGKSGTFEVVVTFMCTTVLQEPLRISVQPGDRSFFVWIDAESEVSFELDEKEVVIGDRVAAGATASVFRGTWRGLDVAVKRMLDNNAGEGAVEARMLCSLKHPNIVVFYGVARQGSLMLLVTEFMPLGSLSEVYQSQTTELPWWLRTKFLLDTALALEYLHGQNVIHRDLK